MLGLLLSRAGVYWKLHVCGCEPDAQVSVRANCAASMGVARFKSTKACMFWRSPSSRAQIR